VGVGHGPLITIRCDASFHIATPKAAGGLHGCRMGAPTLSWSS